MAMIDIEKLKPASDAVTAALEAWLEAGKVLRLTTDQAKAPAVYEEAHNAHEVYHTRAIDLAKLVRHLIAEAERVEGNETPPPAD
jgi:hypothetical protein